MNTTNRSRALWLLVTLVSVHTLVTTAVFLATGTLPNALMAFTLVVFGVCALAAIYFLLNPTRRVHRLDAKEERVVVEERLVVEGRAAPPAEEESFVRIEVQEPVAATKVPADSSPAS